jgi:hypothetical protein
VNGIKKKNELIKRTGFEIGAICEICGSADLRMLIGFA